MAENKTKVGSTTEREVYQPEHNQKEKWAIGEIG